MESNKYVHTSRDMTDLFGCAFHESILPAMRAWRPIVVLVWLSLCFTCVLLLLQPSGGPWLRVYLRLSVGMCRGRLSNVVRP